MITSSGRESYECWENFRFRRGWVVSQARELGRLIVPLYLDAAFIYNIIL